MHNKDAHIQIIGHTSYSGAENKNLLLSQNRDYTVLSQLKDRGLVNSDITAVGVKQPLLNQDNQLQEKINRSVTLKVFLTDKINPQVVNQ